MIQNNKPEYLYLHVPFCKTICSYCDFCHTVYQTDAADQWLDALAKEIQAKQINPNLKTIYIGGGTPTSLSYAQLDQLLTMLDPFSKQVQEYTVEINPETLDDAKAEILCMHGINRASLGFQTSSPTLLKTLGRHHTILQVQQTMECLHRHGITNLSLDLMYSLPGQTMADLQQSVQDALACSPAHLSLYSLTIEENTVFGRKGYQHLDEDTEADMYEWICQALPQAGYHQYEISNFALEGRESMHNKAYWDYRDFYGISIGASGKEGFLRYDHTRNLAEYLKEPTAIQEIPLSKEDAMFEMVMMGLRLKRGLDLRLFADTFDTSFYAVYGAKADALIAKGLLEKDESYCWASQRGFEILNSVLVDLM